MKPKQMLYAAIGMVTVTLGKRMARRRMRKTLHRQSCYEHQCFAPLPFSRKGQRLQRGLDVQHFFFGRFPLTPHGTCGRAPEAYPAGLRYRRRVVSIPASLCTSCSFVRLVAGRRGQTYLLCRSEDVAAKYPPQPVLACPAYEPVKDPVTGQG